jgi:RNA polymerase sigma-70 factor, ECF subfamily
LGTTVKLSESDLISLLKKQDREGYNQLYKNYSGALYGIIFRIVRDEEIAADVLQDSFIKIWKNIDSYNKEKGTLFTWMLNITRNTAIDKLRSKEYKNTSKIRPIEENVGIIDSGNSTENIVDHIGIKGLVDTLADDQKQIIEKIYFEGYTQTEVSEELGVPLGTVKTRVRIAVGKLKNYFKN